MRRRTMFVVSVMSEIILVSVLLLAFSLFELHRENEGTSEEVKIDIDVNEEISEINRGLFGIISPANYYYYNTVLPLLDEMNTSIVRLPGVAIFLELDPFPAEGNYNWDAVDSHIEAYTSKGIRVLTTFTIVPRWLWSENATEDPAWESLPILLDGHTRPPRSYEKWEELIYQTVRHLNVEKGFNVIFEVWNEPNVRYFWRGTLGEYLELYKHTANAVKRADPDTLVGGPSAADFDVSWIEAFIKYCSENDVPVDFVSWHYYLLSFSYHRIGRVYNFTEQIRIVREIISEYPSVGNVKLMNTEWAGGWMPQDEDLLDGPFHAAYIASSIYEMMDAGLESAFFFNILLMTSGDSPKPSLNVFKMFGMLEPTRIQTHINETNSSTGVISSKGEGGITIIVWDFPFDMNETNKLVNITLWNLPSGNYKYTRYLIDNKHSNPGKLEIIEEKIINTNEKLTLEFKLEPYGVTLIRLTKYQ